MHQTAIAPSLIPAETELEFVGADRLQSPILRAPYEHWQRLRGDRRFPSREELKAKHFARALRHMALIRVIGAGADYEYRIVGDSVTMAYRLRGKLTRLSAIAMHAPTTAGRLQGVYRHCVETREPFAVLGRTGRNSDAAKFTRVESVIMPLGADDTIVDHIVTFAIYD